MIQFRQKEYTLQEGHYTGPKDMDKVPGALEIIGKSALGGALAGSAVGAILKDSTAFKGAIEGAKWGSLAGILFKFLINYLHNPMTQVKYQDVDRIIRREFGIFRAAGITVGDSVSKRAELSEKFSFNDRNVTSYKLNFSIQDDQITMYTLGLTNKELDKVNDILDYYCKKYAGMGYDANVINSKQNSYSAHIVFTNNQVISNFLMELSNALETKINLLDNKAVLSGKMNDIAEKDFSVKPINKFEILGLLGKSHKMKSLAPRNWKEALSCTILGMIREAGLKLTRDDLVKYTKLEMPRYTFNNTYLEETLKKLHYIDGFNYTTGRKDIRYNMSMINGLLVVTAPENDKTSKSLDKIFWAPMKMKINRSESDGVIVYTYSVESKSKFEYVLKKLMSTGVNFNIFE